MGYPVKSASFLSTYLGVLLLAKVRISIELADHHVRKLLDVSFLSQLNTLPSIQIPRPFLRFTLLLNYLIVSFRVNFL